MTVSAGNVAVVDHSNSALMFDNSVGGNISVVDYDGLSMSSATMFMVFCCRSGNSHLTMVDSNSSAG